MDFDEYKNFLRAVKKDFGKNLGIEWGTPGLRPVYDPSKELIGWRLKWAGPFSADANYVCVREDWATATGGFKRRYFSYHYGPYLRLDGLEDARWKEVVVRIDAHSYGGRGFHIHDSHKDKRIHQDELSNPDLSTFTIPTFVECVSKVRQGKTVAEAFELGFKK